MTRLVLVFAALALVSQGIDLYVLRRFKRCPIYSEEYRTVRRIELHWSARFWMIAVVVAGLIGGCGPLPRSDLPQAIQGTKLVTLEGTDVLFTDPADVNRLCQLAPNARRDRIYLGCYFKALRLAIVPRDNPDVLAHELRHAREGSFHHDEENDPQAARR